MSHKSILFCVLLAGCGDVPAWVPFVPPPATDTPAAAAWDCSIVRWDRGQDFCRVAAPPPPPSFCSRALGGVDCWMDPAAMANRPRALADNPPPLMLAAYPPSAAAPVPAPIPATPAPATPVPAAAPVPPTPPAPPATPTSLAPPAAKGSHAP